MPKLSRPLALFALAVCVTAGVASFVDPVEAQNDQLVNEVSATRLPDVMAARKELRAAQRREQEARQREALLGERAAEAVFAAEKSQRDVAVLAAQIQTVEASLASARSRLSFITTERRILEQQLGKEREPVVQLTAALQRLTARPLALSALQPGSLRETVYLRAVLDRTVPAIREKTAGLRSQRIRAQELTREAEQTLAALKQSEQDLQRRRTNLMAVTRARQLDSRRAQGDARAEAEKAAEFARQASNLDGLIARLDDAGQARSALAQLPGPYLRPDDPTTQQIAANNARQANPATTSGEGAAGPKSYRLPVIGRTISRFGERERSGLRQSGIMLAPPARAQVTAPAQGTIVFAGPYRGYGRIAIIDHGAGWTSLITGLATLNVEIGERVVLGGPLGEADAANPRIGVELRRQNRAVDPLKYLAD